MPVLTREFLASIGVELDDDSYGALAAHFETTLHERVVEQVVAELTPEQAAQLAQMHQADDPALYPWLQANVPDLGDIVADEVDILLGEVAEDSEKL